MDNRGFDNEGENRPNIDDISPPPQPVQPVSPRPQLSEQKFGPLRPPEKPQPVPDPLPEPSQTPLNRPDIPQVISNNEKPRKRWPKVLAGLIVLALIAFGVWYFVIKNNNEDKGSVAQSTPVSKDIPVLKVGLENVDYGKLYPEMTTNEYSFLTNSQIFEGLVRYENKSKIVPDLAADWTNPDSKTWIFTIKPSIKFHDGNVVTAKDVKYSLDKIRADKSDLSDTFAGTIASVSITGADKVKITTTDPDPTLLNRLAFLYIIDDQLPAGQDASMAGTGPYYAKPGTEPTRTSVQLTAFDGYHGGRPQTRELSFGTEKDAKTLLAAFEAGKYDIIGSVAPTVFDSRKNDFKFVSVEPDVHYVAFNTIKQGPLKNIKVREAIRYALDPLAVGKARGSEVTPLSQMIPESIPGYNPSIMPYKQDVAKAKQLLKEAGYGNGLTLSFSTSDTDRATNEIVKELKTAGITLKVDQHNNFDEFINYFLSGKAEMYTVDYSSDTLDGLDIFRTTISDSYYKNPAFYKKLDEAGATTDPAARLKTLQDAALILDQDIPVVPLSTEDSLWLMDKDYSITQDMPSSYISVYFYKVHYK